jgi:hypothetical protein
MAEPLTDSRSRAKLARNARLRSHLYRSLGVGIFTAWAVTLDRLLSAQPLSVGRWLATAALAGVVWFLTGGGSGVLWQLLPGSGRGDRDRAT